MIGVVVAMAAFMEVLDTSIANVALPYMAGNLGASNDESTWILTSYLVSNAIVLPISGWFATVLGRKRFFMMCLVIFTLSSLAVRDCPQPRGHYLVSRHPGRGRGRTATHGPGDPRRHFSASTARRGLRALWHHRHRRAYDRTDLGRLDYRQLYLALDFLHQPAGGHLRLCFWFIA